MKITEVLVGVEMVLGMVTEDAIITISGMVPGIQLPMVMGKLATAIDLGTEVMAVGQTMEVGTVIGDNVEALLLAIGAAKQAT